MPRFGRNAASALLTAALSVAAWPALAQSPAAKFDRGHHLQNWQDPRYAQLVAKCKTPPKPFGIKVSTNTEPPKLDFPAPSKAIPGVIAAGQSWKTVWSWEGNNLDGPIAGKNGVMLVSNNDAGTVMQIDPATGLGKILFDHINTGGAVSRGKNGELIGIERGLPASIIELEPTRKVLARSFDGEPLECVGGVLNDLAADSHGGAYVAVTGGGVLYVNPKGQVSKYGKDMGGANGIVLSRDERLLYVTNGKVVEVFDVKPDGSLANQRDFAQLHTGGGGDGSAIDTEGRLYVATGEAADVFSPTGEYLGSIVGPKGMHGVAFGGKDKRTLFGIVFYGGWGSPAARNQLIAIPTLAQGYLGRAK